jgi:hypothetical protein
MVFGEKVNKSEKPYLSHLNIDPFKLGYLLLTVCAELSLNWF